jgi:hypothetical protein
MKTTLNRLRMHHPCSGGWEKLLKKLGKTQADDEPLSIITILDSNGLNDALWCLRAVDGEDKKKRLFAVFCARRVQHIMKDDRSIKAIDIAERYANGLATEEELDAAAWAAEPAAWDEAMGAAWAARCAARYAAWAAEPAGWDAAWAARCAAWAVASASDAAAEAAARAAARAVASASDASEPAAWDEARDAAWDAEKKAQEQALRSIILS